MPTVSRTIRLFVSSTFSDMKAARDVLQREVFPKLRQFCLANGIRAQPSKVPICPRGLKYPQPVALNRRSSRADPRPVGQLARAGLRERVGHLRGSLGSA